MLPLKVNKVVRNKITGWLKTREWKTREKRVWKAKIHLTETFLSQS